MRSILTILFATLISFASAQEFKVVVDKTNVAVGDRINYKIVYSDGKVTPPNFGSFKVLQGPCNRTEPPLLTVRCRTNVR